MTLECKSSVVPSHNSSGCSYIAVESSPQVARTHGEVDGDDLTSCDRLNLASVFLTIPTARHITGVIASLYVSILELMT